MNLRKGVERKTGVKVQSLNETADFTGNAEIFEKVSNLNRYHLYKCKGCVVRFAVEEEFDDQSIITCPSCKTADHIIDIGLAMITLVGSALDEHS